MQLTMLKELKTQRLIQCQFLPEHQIFLVSDNEMDKSIKRFNDYDVLHHTQSGFRSKHSTVTALTFMTENWLKAVNDGKIVGTIMVGFRKTFDLVDHALLLETLSYFK